MTYVITSLCLRDSGCVEYCPVECIVPGHPREEYPLFYIDPDTCIDCGACVPECPYEAIFPEDEVPDAYEAKGGEYISMPASSGLSGAYSGSNHHGETVELAYTRQLDAGEVLDFTADIQANADYFSKGMGYGGNDKGREG